jgi:hypothetical protein
MTRTKTTVVTKSTATAMVAIGAVVAGGVTASPASAYHAGGTSWQWSGQVGAGTRTASFSETVTLDSFRGPVGCGNAWFSGSSGVWGDGASWVKLRDRFWENHFGPSGVYLSWPPGVGQGNGGMDTWETQFNGAKGSHQYANPSIHMELGWGTSFTGVNHEISASGKYGTGEVWFGNTNVGEAVC